VKGGRVLVERELQEYRSFFDSLFTEAKWWRPITLSPLTIEDERAIRSWPSYPAEYKDLDYALRDKGWLADFPAGAGNYRFAARLGSRLVGFSILTTTGPDEAEFYIAVHAEALGQGYGMAIARMVVRRGFEEAGLRKIHLKVREWHDRAIRLYEKLGFRRTGVKELEINGTRDRFVLMELDRPTNRPA
jgi:RimJ/RimL family protein N-acetyltransferase